VIGKTGVHENGLAERALTNRLDFNPVSAANAVKRIATLAAIAIAAGIVAVAGATLVIPVDAVRSAVTSEIRAVTGLDPVLRGPVSISMFPAGTVTFSDVVLGESATGEPAFAAAELTANLRLTSLLAGRIEIADISLVRPRIAVTVGEDGHTNWSPLIDTLARALKPNAPQDERVLSFSEIRINDGVVAIRNPSRNIDEKLEGVELSLAWPRIAKSFAATGSLRWHNENVDASINIADFPAALAGDNSGVKFRASAGPLKAAFDGVMGYEPSLKIDGTLAADAASLREALQWIGHRQLPAGGLGQFALKARATLVGGTIALSNLNVELDGNSAEGALTYAATGQQLLQGTLAVETLDLSPYVSTVRLVADNPHDWDRGSFALEWLKDWEADLRLSAAGVHFTHAQLGRTAVTATLRSGQLNVTVGESQSFGGLVTGTFAITKAKTGAAFKSQMRFADVDLAKCLGELVGLRRVDGTGTVAFSVESEGVNVEELADNLNGTAEIAAKQGALTGLNVDQLLRRLQRSPLSGNGDFRSGRTPFDKLNIGLRIVQGTATAEDVHLEGQSVRVAVTGMTSIAHRDLDLAGTATLIAAADTGATFELPFVVQGPWDNPLILPDTQTLIRRSGATAPLLDALQDRRSREPVRSVIERLIGAGAATGIGIAGPAGAAGTAGAANQNPP
jgi:AsmA protein